MPSPPPPRHGVRRQQINVSTVNVLFFSFSFLSFFFLPRPFRPYSTVMTDQTICLRRVLFPRNPFTLTFTDICMCVCVCTRAYINTHLHVCSLTVRLHVYVYIITSFTRVHNNRHGRKRPGIKSEKVYERDAHTESALKIAWMRGCW